MQAGKFAASALAAICLTACADPKAASKANFKKALDAYFDQTRAPACIDLRSLDAPFPATLPDQRNELGDSLNNAVQILAMASVGLLTGSPTTIAPRGFTLDKPTPVAATRYDLSELGKKYYQDRVIGGGLGKMTLHQLCFGTPKSLPLTATPNPQTRWAIASPRSATATRSKALPNGHRMLQFRRHSPPSPNSLPVNTRKLTYSCSRLKVGSTNDFPHGKLAPRSRHSGEDQNDEIAERANLHLVIPAKAGIQPLAGDETTLRLHAGERLERHSLRRSDFRSRQAHLGTQERRGGWFHKKVSDTQPRLVRAARDDGVGDRPGKSDQGMEAPMENRRDRSVQPKVAGSLSESSLIHARAGFQLSLE